MYVDLCMIIEVFIFIKMLLRVEVSSCNRDHDVLNIKKNNYFYTKEVA